MKTLNKLKQHSYSITLTISAISILIGLYSCNDTEIKQAENFNVIPCTTNTETVELIPKTNPVPQTLSENTISEHTRNNSLFISALTNIINTVDSTYTKSISDDSIVYKPSTHYIHKISCRWYDDTCTAIITTDDIEARLCTECKPDIVIKNPYEDNNSNNTAVDDYSYQLLAEIVYHEAGCSWITEYDKARIVAGVMNRVNDSRFPNTVYEVLIQPNQFTGYYPNSCCPTYECYSAVDYYFSHIGEFDNCNSWYGDGVQNYFYYQ